MDNIKNHSKVLFGKKLKSALRNVGLKQFQLAEIIGVEPANVSRWINGKHYPERKHFEKICNLLNVSESYFLEGPTQSEVITELSKVVAHQQLEIEKLQNPINDIVSFFNKIRPNLLKDLKNVIESANRIDSMAYKAILEEIADQISAKGFTSEQRKALFMNDSTEIAKVKVKQKKDGSNN